jgi:hypothetical protein
MMMLLSGGAARTTIEMNRRRGRAAKHHAVRWTKGEKRAKESVAAAMIQI